MLFAVVIANLIVFKIFDFPLIRDQSINYLFGEAHSHDFYRICFNFNKNEQAISCLFLLANKTVPKNTLTLLKKEKILWH